MSQARPLSSLNLIDGNSRPCPGCISRAPRQPPPARRSLTDVAILNPQIIGRSKSSLPENGLRIEPCKLGICHWSELEVNEGTSELPILNSQLICVAPWLHK